MCVYVPARDVCVRSFFSFPLVLKGFEVETDCECRVNGVELPGNGTNERTNERTRKKEIIIFIILMLD